MRWINKLILFLFLLILFSQIVFGIGIKPSKISLDFVPGYEAEFKFVVSDTDDNTNIRLSVHGDLAEYVTLSTDIIRHEENHAFTVRVSLPDTVEKPGRNRILIRAELAPINVNAGGISAIGAVQAPIDVFVPYPGKYLEYKIGIHDVNEGEPVDFSLTVTNLGTQTVELVWASVDVVDSEGNRKNTFITEQVALASKTSHVFSRVIDTTAYKPGAYSVKATVFHDDGEELLEEPFRIGTLHVDIANYTKDFLVDEINRFELKVDSKWNTQIERVYAQVDVSIDSFSTISFRTLDTFLEPFETKILEGFFDTDGIEEGEYDANITLFYEAEITNEKGKFNIRKSRRFEFPTGFSVTLLLIIIILGIIAVDIWWMVRERKKKENEKK